MIFGYPIVTLLFYAFAGVLVMSAIGMITSRNPVHAAMYLVFAFFNSAIIWMLMEAEFLAIVLVLVYVGAVMVLFMFVVMMLDINMAQLREAPSSPSLSLPRLPVWWQSNRWG
jgi:NADH-quinone oxidoreductase subunit J